MRLDMVSSLSPYFQEKSKTISGNNGAYVELIPRLEVSDETELFCLRSVTLDFRMMQAGLKKGERAAVSKAIGNLSYLSDPSNIATRPLYHVTVKDIRNSTVDELALLPDSGRRTATILKKLVG